MNKLFGFPGGEKMIERLSLFIKGIPFAKQSARFHSMVRLSSGKTTNFDNFKKYHSHDHDAYILTKSYQKKEIKEKEQDIRQQVISQLPFDFKPFDCPLIVEKLDFIFPPLKSFNNTIKNGLLNPKFIIYKITKPDINDNLNKGLFDAMEGVVFLNDSQIVEMRNVRRIYGPIPGIDIRFRTTSMLSKTGGD